MARRRHPGPGLARPRSPFPAFEQERRGIRTVESIWRAWLAKADIVSEGRVDEDGVYRGSTSIWLAAEPEGVIPRQRVEWIARAAALDPHFRVQAVRLARREAAWRCEGQLETMQAEMAVRADDNGVYVELDVVARLAMGRARAHR